MSLDSIDWSIIIAILLISLIIGVIASKRAGKSSSEFFLSGRNMPWWLLGISMVATTFSADTPNLVTDIVRKHGVSGNWYWWAFLLTGMLTVFIYSKLWRRTKVLTDLEFYELRYSGPVARFLRGFRAIYLGVIFNVFVLATVCVAAIKISAILLGLSPMQTILIASVITVIYSGLGGLRGVIYTDLFQFIIAMVGSIWACMEIVNMPQVNGVQNLLQHPNVFGNLSLIPDLSDPEKFIPIFLIPLAVQWWAAWYPGSEPGGGGYVAQRMLAAKDEKNAVAATLLFNLSHYALRPWPWILIALASLIVVPLSISEDQLDQVYIAPEAEQMLQSVPYTNLQFALNKELEEVKQNAIQDESKEEMLSTIVNCLQKNPQALQLKALAYLYNARYLERNENSSDVEYPSISSVYTKVNLFLAAPQTPLNKLDQDNAYSLMLAYLPKGLIGLVLASLIAAFMSTLSSHLNWGASYISHDFYHRFVNKEASERQLVNVGRISTLALMLLAAILALYLESALDAFKIIVSLGAGTGLIFILRWFWKRINAYTEIAGMIISFVVAITFMLIGDQIEGHWLAKDHWQLLVAVGITTLGWLIVTLLTKPEDSATLARFNKAIGNEKGQIRKNLLRQVLLVIVGSIGIFSFLFMTGYVIYGLWTAALISFALVVLSSIIIYINWKKIFD